MLAPSFSHIFKSCSSIVNKLVSLESLLYILSHAVKFSKFSKVDIRYLLLWLHGHKCAGITCLPFKWSQWGSMRDFIKARLFYYIPSDHDMN